MKEIVDVENPALNVQHMTNVIDSRIMRQMASDRQWDREDRKQFAKSRNNLYRQSQEIAQHLH